MHKIVPFAIFSARRQEEITRIVSACGPGWERRVVIGAFETGLRPNENFGLKRRDMDFDSGLVNVRQTFSRYGVAATKNKR